MKCIQIKNLTKKFKDVIAVNNISFNVEQGEIFGLLGSNGAGKTTTMNILTGLLLPTKGSVNILGMNLEKDIEKIREEIAIVPQEISLYEDLSVYENLNFFGKIYAKNKKNLNKKIDELLNLFNLTDKKNKSIYQLSGGYQRRLSIAVALLANPKILFLDEPLVGIDLATSQMVMDYIKNQQGDMTIIITTHSIKEAAEICDSILFMHEGKTKLYGNPQQLIKEYSKIFGERITIKFKGKLDEDYLNKILRKYKNEIKGYWFDNDYIIFDINKIGEEVYSLINSIKKMGIKILDIDIKKPNLEDVFRHSVKDDI